MIKQKAKPSQTQNSALRIGRKLTPIQLYRGGTLLCLLVLLFALFLSHGSLWEHFLFYDSMDTGMDFFHSIEYVRGRMPYGMFDTLYPPLANLFFYALYLLVPKTLSDQWTMSFDASYNMRGTDLDLRLYQAPMLLFILFVVASVLGILLMTDKLMEHSGENSRRIGVCFLFSFCVMFGLERGNIVLLCWPLVAFFVVFRKSDNAFLRELSYLALAVAAGFKLYPAFFGILLLRDKQYMAAVRTVLYGVAAFICPLFLFNEGLMGISLWLKTLFDFTSGSGYPWIGNGLANILSEAGHFVDHFLGTQLAYGSYALFGIAAAAILLVCALLLDQEWKRVLAVVAAIIMFQSQADYVFCFMLIPLCLFFVQEKTISRRNAVPFALMALLTLPLPLFYSGGRTATFSARNTLYHLGLIVLVIWCLAEAVRCRKAAAAPAAKAARVTRRQLRATAGVAAAVLAAMVLGRAAWGRMHNWGIDYGYTGNIGTDGILEEEVTASDGSTVEVRWCSNDAYAVIYNHAPFAQDMEITFTTGYGMDLSKSHILRVFTDDEMQKVRVEEEGQQVRCTVTVQPGETSVRLRYDGPNVFYEKADNKYAKFSVVDFEITNQGPAEQ